MISAVFYLNNGEFKGFEISGHEEHDGEYGMICAAVSSCAMLVCNTLTEKLDAKARADVCENSILLRLSDGCTKESRSVVEAFYEHLETLSQEYGELNVERLCIKI